MPQYIISASYQPVDEAPDDLFRPNSAARAMWDQSEQVNLLF